MILQLNRFMESHFSLLYVNLIQKGHEMKVKYKNNHHTASNWLQDSTVEYAAMYIQGFGIIYMYPFCVNYCNFQETPVSETSASEAAASTMKHAEDIRSPSPSLSVSGSETSSIMQKLRKMRSHMDEK